MSFHTSFSFSGLEYFLFPVMIDQKEIGIALVSCSCLPTMNVIIDKVNIHQILHRYNEYNVAFYNHFAYYFEKCICVFHFQVFDFFVLLTHWGYRLIIDNGTIPFDNQPHIYYYSIIWKKTSVQTTSFSKNERQFTSIQKNTPFLLSKLLFQKYSNFM